MRSLLICLSLITLVQANRIGVHENVYCQLEEVNTTCSNGQVVAIETAHYGRININRCIKRSFGMIGCYNDVTKTIGQWCSASQGCVFGVPDVNDIRGDPCDSELKSALSLSYRCIPVDNGKRCGEERKLILNHTSGFLSSYYAYITDVGTRGCPIILQALPGQRINLTLHTYINKQETTSRHDSSKCPYHLSITDHSRAVVIDNVPLCDDTMVTKHVYTSTSNSIRLHFMGRFGASNRYLIEYKVIGCPSLTPPHSATYEYLGDGKGAVRCAVTKEVWFVTCLGNAWLGNIGNCSEPLGVAHDNPEVRRKPFPASLTLAIIAGLFLGMTIGIILLFLVLMYKRRHRNRRTPQPNNKLLNGTESHYEQGNYCRHPCQATNCDGRCYAPTTLCGRSQIYNRGNYTQCVEMKPQPCQYHCATLPAQRKLVPPTSGAESSVDYNDMTSSLLPSHNTPQKVTTFSTFKPVESADSEADKYGTNFTRNGILKHSHCDENTQCACANGGLYGTAYETPVSGNGDLTQPDVVQTNRLNEQTALTYTNTRNIPTAEHERLTHSYSHSSA